MFVLIFSLLNKEIGVKVVEKVDDGHCNGIIFQNLKQTSGADLIGLNRNCLIFWKNKLSSTHFREKNHK